MLFMCARNRYARRSPPAPPPSLFPSPCSLPHSLSTPSSTPHITARTIMLCCSVDAVRTLSIIYLSQCGESAVGHRNGLVFSLIRYCILAAHPREASPTVHSQKSLSCITFIIFAVYGTSSKTEASY